MLSKATVRQTSLEKRRQLSSEQIRQSGLRFAHQLSQFSPFTSAATIAFYYPHGNELDTRPAIEQSLAANKSVFLPALLPRQELRFHRFESATTLQANRYGIMETINTPAAPIDDLAIIVLPLLGADKHGNRVGMGAGYYDRTLAAIANAPNRPLLIGAGYDFQRFAAIENDPWDIAIDAIITPDGTTRFKGE